MNMSRLTYKFRQLSGGGGGRETRRGIDKEYSGKVQNT